MLLRNSVKELCIQKIVNLYFFCLRLQIYFLEAIFEHEIILHGVSPVVLIQKAMESVVNNRALFSRWLW